MIKTFIRPKPKNTNLRVNDLTRHLSLMGTCLFMMVCPAYENDDAEIEVPKEKKGKKKMKSE